MTEMIQETPHERFLRMAPTATDAVLEALDRLGKLAGPDYQFEPPEVQQILDAVFDATHDMKRRFERKRAASLKGFAFKSPRQRSEDKERMFSPEPSTE